jgi:hypothetical protein
METVDPFVDEELVSHNQHTARDRDCPLCRECNHPEVERDDDGLNRWYYVCQKCWAEVTPVNDPEGPYWVSLDE